MDKLEYIPRDLVMTKTEPNDFIPNGIVCRFNEYVFRDNVQVSTVMLADNFICKKEDIAPIPITPEILEKNRWEKLNKVPINCTILYKSRQGLTIGYNINSKTFIYDFEVNQQRNIKFIHELQHLLFGLGLNSEMEV